jgi:ABC-type multidrug transport system ATPase subunit
MHDRMSEDIVVTRDLQKKFGNFEALKDLNIEVKPGLFGLVGPNGAGKTTLIRILLGLIKPSSGKAFVLGHDVENYSFEIRRMIGCLHEKPSYPKNIEALEYLKKVEKLYQVEPCITPDRLIELVGLAEAKERPIGKLSAGMLQRLGIAQALVGNPAMVILDEPTSNLDVVGRSEILDMLLALHQQSGISFFISSHVLSELEKICDHVAFIKNGLIVESGTVMEIISKHAQDKFVLRVSDPQRLFQAIGNVKHIQSLKISGSTAISLQTEAKYLNEVRGDIENIAVSLGIKIYLFEPLATLEEAFREITESEKPKKKDVISHHN